MKVGVVYEDYHSEVAEFIFEMLQFKLDANIVLYNNKDRYDNTESYLKKYNRIQKRSLGTFVKDLVEDRCDKMIVVSYGNLFKLELLSEYKEKLIFIAHDDSQQKQLEELKLTYFTLTSLLSKNMKDTWKYMLPICKDSKMENDYSNISDIEDKEKMEIRRTYIKDNNLKSIMMVGHFLENNRNMELIKKLLETQKVFLYIFAPSQTKELDELRKISKHILCGIRFSTNIIEKMIKENDIKHVLFAPPNDSKFFKTQWSGTIAFALNRGMTLIMPDELAKEYHLSETSITYKSENDITVDFVEKIEAIDQTKTREDIYKRNSIVMELLVTGKYKDFVLSNGVFVKNDQEKVGLDNVDSILENISDNSNVYVLNTETAKLAVETVKNKENCNVYIFNKDLDKCLMQKFTLMLYNYTNKVRVFNEELREGVTIDAFNMKVDMIVKEGDNFYEITQGGKNTLNKYKPRLVLISENEMEKPVLDGYLLNQEEVVNTKLDKFHKVEWVNIEK